jgi:hypothetical protein
MDENVKNTPGKVIRTIGDFLCENFINDVTEEIIVSKRLKDYKFKINAMSGDQFADYQKVATKLGRHGKVEFDGKKFNELLILNHCVEPCFRDVVLIEKAGCKTPEQLMNKVLLAGEINSIVERISTLSGFDSSLDELVEDAKNS